MSRISAVLALMCFCSAPSVWAGHTLRPNEQKILHEWLKKHPELRQATDADCKCAEHIRQMRTGSGDIWVGVPDYHPYVATGDFNGDGIRDFAVEVVNSSGSEPRFTLVVFNGPFKASKRSPDFYDPGIDLFGQALFFGPPRPKPYRLVIGPFNSDNSVILSPHGNSYMLDVSPEP